MKVIIGIDDSPYAKTTLDFVKQMQWPKGARLLVVSAAQPVYPMTEVGVADYVATANEEIQRHHGEIAAAAAAELKTLGLDATAHVPHGDPRDMLVVTARGEGAQLIIVGSHGKSRLEKLLVGSVASYVVSHAPCSVLVVKVPRLGT
jgi:nucleotide-binding universal stress UspA family protein